MRAAAHAALKLRKTEVIASHGRRVQGRSGCRCGLIQGLQRCLQDLVSKPLPSPSPSSSKVCPFPGRLPFPSSRAPVHSCQSPHIALVAPHVLWLGHRTFSGLTTTGWEM